MRRVVLYALVSLDGVGEEPGDWMFDVDDAVFANLARVIGTQDDILLGRGTHDYWVDYWPTSDVQPFADFVNGTPKHVFTSTEPTTRWAHTSYVGSPAADHVRALRAGDGRDIGIHGSLRLGRSLLDDGLVDRISLVVVPTLAGSGRRLLEPAVLHRLTLRHSAASPTGAVFLDYDVSQG